MNAHAITEALAHHQAGRLAEAEALYRQILAVQPQHPDALHLLGVLAHQVGQQDAAVELIRQAIAVKPDEAAFHANLGRVYRAVRRLAEAAECYRQALAIQPDYPEAHSNLANALSGLGRFEEAIESYHRAIKAQPDFAGAHNNLGAALAGLDRLDETILHYQQALLLRPDYAEAHNNLGNALSRLGRHEEAIVSFQQAVEIKPDFAEAYNNLGAALARQGRLAEAISCYERALALRADYAEAYNNLGNVLSRLGRHEEAVQNYRQALEIQPDYVEAHHNLGSAFVEQGNLDAAVESMERALSLRPDYAEARSNLGNAFKDQGKLDEALACYREADRLAPDKPMFLDNVLYTLHFHPGRDPATLFAEHQEWERRHGAARRQFLRPHPNVPLPNRRLKIGYVSPDFREHPVGRFLLPLLENHDHQHCEITCYADVARPDRITDRLRECAHQWRDTAGVSEEQLTQQIRDDGMDILVDLALHTAGNRLPVFARKPAPVQVSFAGYPGTTGLEVMDYRLSDPYLDPSEPVAYSSEEVIRLPNSFWLFAPPEDGPAVTDLPSSGNGHLTFGCLGNFGKINEQVLALWARMLRAVPASRLFLMSGEGSHRERTRETLQALGIAAERVEFVKPCARLDYFALYQQVDIVLDTFPYNGHNTSLDALWMGVPVVNIIGKTAVGRGGLSLLSNVGLPELVAYTEEEYIKIAADLANHLPRLAKLRATMRERMQGSPLMDAPRFARNIEDAYRKMWQNWCRIQRH